MKKCNMCEIQKPLECFNKNRNKKSGYEGYCRDCRKKYYKVEFKTLTGRTRLLKNNCAQRSRERGHDFNLTNDWIKERIEQGCVLTGLEFNMTDVNSPYSPSIDRIDSDKGYTMDNCRLIITIANYAKNEWNDEVLYVFASKLINFRGLV